MEPCGAVSSLHHSASQPQPIPSRFDFSSGGGTRNSPGRSWEERILDLSSELQQICGSPQSPPFFFVGGRNAVGGDQHAAPWWSTSTSSNGGSSNGGRGGGTPPPPAPVAAAPPPPPPPMSPAPVAVATPRAAPLLPAAVRRVRWSTVSPPNHNHLITRSDSGPTTITEKVMTPASAAGGGGGGGGVGGGGGSARMKLVRRTISLQGNQVTSSGLSPPRPIIVRHVETHETLAKRLSAICGGGGGRSTTTRTSNPEKDENRRQVAFARPGDSTSGVVRMKTVIAPFRVDDVIVTVRNSGRRLLVQAFAGSAPGAVSRPLFYADLPPDVAGRLMCHVTTSGSLYVTERPGGALVVEYVDTEFSFVPVLCCDEDRLEMTLVVGVPDDFRFEDVTVRTVDDNVWISGSRSASPTPPPAPTAAEGQEFQTTSTTPPATSSTPKSRFRVVVPLPDGTDNRSVVAALTARNQVIVKARLGNASRRYTF